MYRVRLPALADAVAPGIVLAQAVGRFGNWFNQELFGRPTSHWWGLQIDPAHRPPGYEHYTTFQPTFLFESIWDVGTAVFVVLVDRRWRLGHGRVFALYVMAYTAGRGWIEYLRIDTVNHFLGLRLNVWTSIVVFVLAAVYFVVVGRLHPGRETSVMRDDPVASSDVGEERPEVPAATAADGSADEDAAPDPVPPGPPADDSGGTGDPPASPA
jgi:prolipoprotein diacylglyceryl transferase